LSFPVYGIICQDVRGEVLLPCEPIYDPDSIATTYDWLGVGDDLARVASLSIIVQDVTGDEYALATAGPEHKVIYHRAPLQNFCIGQDVTGGQFLYCPYICSKTYTFGASLPNSTTALNMKAAIDAASPVIGWGGGNGQELSPGFIVWYDPVYGINNWPSGGAKVDLQIGGDELKEISRGAVQIYNHDETWNSITVRWTGTGGGLGNYTFDVVYSDTEPTTGADMLSWDILASHTLTGWTPAYSGELRIPITDSLFAKNDYTFFGIITDNDRDAIDPPLASPPGSGSYLSIAIKYVGDETGASSSSSH
jgi:hypothetical protein